MGLTLGWDGMGVNEWSRTQHLTQFSTSLKGFCSSVLAPSSEETTERGTPTTAKSSTARVQRTTVLCWTNTWWHLMGLLLLIGRPGVRAVSRPRQELHPNPHPPLLATRNSKHPLLHTTKLFKMSKETTPL